MAQSPSTEPPPTLATGNPPPVSSKPKPAIPPRTAGVGGKIAALKAGFLSDLDQRLKLGPQAPKKEEKPSEEEEDREKEVLSDVRKSRARGPKGRKLPTAKEPEAKPEDVRTDVEASKIQVVGVWTVWSMGEEGVSVYDEPEPKVEEAKDFTAPALSMSILSGVSTIPAAEKDVQVPASPPTADAADAAEKRGEGQLVTAIPEDQHPEDAVETSKTLDVDVNENGQGDITNTEGDERVDV
jgi:hypothetical protein